MQYFYNVSFCFRTATKLAIGVGAVYVTLDQGVWSTSKQSSKALHKVRNDVLPTASNYLEKVKGPWCIDAYAQYSSCVFHWGMGLIKELN